MFLWVGLTDVCFFVFVFFKFAQSPSTQSRVHCVLSLTSLHLSCLLSINYCSLSVVTQTSFLKSPYKVDFRLCVYILWCPLPITHFFWCLASHACFSFSFWNPFVCDISCLTSPTLFFLNTFWCCNDSGGDCFCICSRKEKQVVTLLLTVFGFFLRSCCKSDPCHPWEGNQASC